MYGMHRDMTGSAVAYATFKALCNLESMNDLDLTCYLAIGENLLTEKAYKSGEVITLKNEYPLNCEAFFAKQMKKKELQKLKDNEISLIKIYTYKKNYEMYVSEVQNQDIHHYIDCLSAYKIKKTDEVKLKNKDKRSKNNDHQPSTGNYQPIEQ
jgi:hypothetical protein